MWTYERRLEYPVNIKESNAKLAQVIISQYGGPDGEMGASMRYLSQRYACPYREVSAILTDIGVSVTKLRILGFKCTPEGRTLRSLSFFNNLHRENISVVIVIFTTRTDSEFHAKRNAFQPYLYGLIVIDNHFIEDFPI